jgi:tyrosyl-tRNA synthetase
MTLANRSNDNFDQKIQALSRRCEKILTEPDLRAKFKHSAETGKPMRIKLGMDPTAPDVTLGHAVPLKVVRQFQDWGHKAVLIIGDYTARVGDPTGRNQTRKMLTGEEIDANAQTYVSQLGKILLTDPDHLEVRYNGEWLGKMGLVDIIKLASRKSLAQVLTRDDFAKRYAEGTPIHLHEILYPLLQGWDSVMIDADVEMGGSDQLFNNLVGREFQTEDGKSGQVVIVTPLLVGTDGVKKMSKSLGNYIGVTDPPGGQHGMFGKVMKLPDELMESYYALVTDLPPEEYRPLVASSPRDAKVGLAKDIITWLHGPDAASAAEADWNSTKEGGIPQDTPTVRIDPAPTKLAPVLTKAGLTRSNSEATQKIKEGAVYLDGQRATDLAKLYTFEKPTIIKVGRKYVEIVPG